MSATSSTPTFWKPGASQPGSSLDRTSSSLPLLPPPSTSPSTLPIDASRLSILRALETSQILILIGSTGSGKTTQLPSILLSSGWAARGTIACTQPRRITATSVASRVASELGVPLGQEVGYTVRFEDHSSSQTKIRYMTHGALLRECLRDPLLTRYSVVMVDEVHERSVDSDLLLGVLSKICRRRPELRVVVASATVDVRAMHEFWRDAAVVQVDGRSFPVETAFLTQPCADYVAETVETIWRIHLAEPRGDVLAFLTGRAEIDAALQALSDRQSSLPASAARMHLLPLHAGLSPSEQAELFAPAPAGTRKVVVATNIAETGLTLDGIVYVVDCGLVKLRTASSAHSLLSVVPISRASAVQRSGRAGRTRAGKCFRLYTESTFQAMERSTAPELTRVALDGTVLALKCLGVDNLPSFAWIPPAPPITSLAAALGRLVRLGALDAHARLTRDGAMMGELPLPPPLARVLVESARRGCASEMLSLLAMMSITTPFYAEMRAFQAKEGDAMTLLNVYLGFTGVGARGKKWCTRHRLNFAALSRALNIRTQLHRYLVRFAASAVELDPSCSVLGKPDAVERLTRCLCTGLYANLARYDAATMTYRLALGGDEVWVHPSSVLFNRAPQAGRLWVVYGEATQADDGRIFIRDIAVLGDLTWVTDAVPGLYDVKTQWGGSTGKVQTSAGDESCSNL